MDRKIIHIDMDAFFASIEQRDHPELRGKPVIIGGNPERHGVVSTCSYEARAYGVHSAMPMVRALRFCPGGVFLEGDMRRYKAVSEQLRGILSAATELVEPVSIDEAYLDVTRNRYDEKSATRLAQRLQREIFEELHLTASAGVSYCKFLAKVASDQRKPAGLFVIRPDQAEEFLEHLPIEKFHGIGRVTAARFKELGVHTGRDLKRLSREALASEFGKTGEYFYAIVRGIDPRPVEPVWARKSFGRETTLTPDLVKMSDIRITLRSLALKVGKLLAAENVSGRTVTVKVRYPDFRTVTRSQTVTVPLRDGAAIAELALALLARTEAGTLPVRLLGVTVSNPPEENTPGSAVQPELPFD